MNENEQFMRHWTQAQPVVASYTRSLVRNHHDVEDVLQDVVVILLRKFSEYDASRPFVAWAIGITRLHILATRQAQARSTICQQSKILDAVSKSFIELAPELDARASALTQCLEKVEGRARMVLELRYARSLSTSQIALQLGTADGAVRVLLSRARSMLQTCIERQMSAERRAE